MSKAAPNSEWAAAVLLGSDHNVLGEAEILEPAAGIAIGISRGRFAKGYPHVDPNEDAVYAASDGETTILAVADGHQGVEASHAAIRAVAESAATDSGESVDHLAMRLAGSSVEAVARVAPALPPPRVASRTSLTIAAIRANTIAAITIGDTSSFVSTRRRLSRIGDATEFLSAETDEGSLLLKSVTLPSRCSVIVTSDGIVDFTSDTERLLRSVSQLPPRDAVEQLIEAAFAGGAGDNLSVGILRRP